MSALKDFKYKESEDGELPSLVTGSETNLNEILSNVKGDGGINLVNIEKVDRCNQQISAPSNDSIFMEKKIPVTIITGYLGSGKSTLLEKIVLKGSDMKIAVILNEFGDSSEIEKAMTIRNQESSTQEWLDLGNGCLCCSLKNVGVKAIEDMIARSPGKIDYILLETSGIADPAPIAKMFWQDDGLNSNVYIDGIVTVLDSEHILKCLDDISPETHWHGENVITKENLTIAHFQIAMADVIILNKFDKIENNEKLINEVNVKIGQINSTAKIHFTKYGELPLNYIIDLHSYDRVNFTNNEKLMARSTLHDPRMSSVMLTFRPFKNNDEFLRFEKKFLQVLLWKEFGVTTDTFNNNMKKEWEIQRTKGLIVINNENSKSKDEKIVKVIQGVRDTYDVLPGQSETSNCDECKIVFIGKYLDQEKIQDFLSTVIN
ncbi:GTP-dependent zinc transferase NDAI_0K01550 [Naumovozyma dairenensis CBS 421]|uniref:Uncharacterized protein n=1 Tax=Naumovozyma dairenensis (strain ATCC 10597 / BCRC 20456 / CBS 421 / NBRC 0211 / NRRL Y-12639) TaxID=1071378 RepID=G0WHT5_NAUDC|nr:hypothetical protein NDAI_0K01550 [Naumovozyma dairenensis CBS 421]CCD27346.1 hypothetical protein NDAI_0K01550 [Naumovozyma dairenensis CBS 421]